VFDNSYASVLRRSQPIDEGCSRRGIIDEGCSRKGIITPSLFSGTLIFFLKGMYDINNGSANTANTGLADENFALFNNAVVTQIPEPAMGALAFLRRVGLILARRSAAQLKPCCHDTGGVLRSVGCWAESLQQSATADADRVRPTVPAAS
jgi:hypothetical protein